MKGVFKYSTQIFLLVFCVKSFAQIGINATNTPPAANAMLDISSTTKGLLIPRMTSIQRNALVISDGLTVYDTDTKSYWYVKGAVWAEMVGTGGGSSGPWAIAGNNISNTNTDNVGIGITNPLAKLHVAGTEIISNDLNVGGTGFLAEQIVIVAPKFHLAV